MPTIPVDQIDVPDRFFATDPNNVAELAISIKHLGLMNPITVVADPDRPPRLRLVAGLSRFMAVQKLGWGEIECRVMTYDDVSRDMAEISENLHRRILTLAERDRALARYAQLYAVTYPEVGAALANQRQAKLRVGMEEPAGSAAAPEVRPQATEVLAKQFQVSKRTVQKALRRAEAFSDDERQVLEAAKVDQKHLDRLTSVPPAERVQVVSLIGANMSFPDAMKEVLGDDFEGDPDEDVAITDEEFLAAIPIMTRVNRARLTADALLSREIRQARIAFSREIAWASMKRRVGMPGLFYSRLLRLLDCRHPREWIVCHECVRGTTKAGDCPKCKGGGYLIS